MPVAGQAASDAPKQVTMLRIPRSSPWGFWSSCKPLRRNESAAVIPCYLIAERIACRYVVPGAFDKRVAPAVAAAVAKTAMEQGIARVQRDPEEIKAATAKRIANHY